MRGTTRAAYGAICWRPNTPIDDAIQLVRAFDDRDEAIACAAKTCGIAEQWAVVDLTSMTVTAQGSRADNRADAPAGGPQTAPNGRRRRAASTR